MNRAPNSLPAPAEYLCSCTFEEKETLLRLLLEDLMQSKSTKLIHDDKQQIMFLIRSAGPALTPEDMKPIARKSQEG